ncbi:MAG: hypothetical protein JST66_07920 [Bacteroidetes bacterium]|nr:hypothetical protein [Bacteroidota bacterium]
MNARGVHRLFLVLLVLSLAKYAYLARFAHPGADDFCYAAKSRDVPLLAWSVGEYHDWNGRYASNLLMARGPLTWSLDFLPGYRLVAIGLLVFTWAAAWALLRACTRDTLTPGRQAAVAAVFLGLFLHHLPDLAEGFYWYTGAITYQLGNILLLLYLAGHATLGGRYRERPWATLGLALLAVVLAGMDEVHMLLLAGGHAVAFGLAYARTRRADRSLLLFLALAVACGIVVAAAPGNAVRGALHAHTHQLGRSLGLSLLQTGRFVLIWMLSPVLLVLSLLYIPFHRQLRDTLPFLRPALPPWAISGLLVLLVFACVFPAYWSTGVLGQYRTLNVACFLFLLGWWIHLSAWLEHPWGQRLQAVRFSPVVAVLLLSIAAADLELSRNGLRAWADLANGRAQRADAALRLREADLRQAAASPRTVVIMAPLADPPKTLFTLEEHGPESRWMSTCTARYFGMDDDRVRMAPPAP